jgi:hypothetical protein
MSPVKDCQVNGLSLGYEPEPNRALRLKGAPEVGGLSPHRSRCGTTQAVPIQSAAAAALASVIPYGAKVGRQVIPISALDEDADGSLSIAAERIGGPLRLGRIWEPQCRIGCLTSP